MSRLKELKRWLVGVEPLGTDPVPQVVRAPRPFLAWLLGPETLPVDPVPQVTKSGRSFLSWLLAIESLGPPESPPVARAPQGPGLASALFRIDPLPRDPVPAHRPKRPFLKWLLWPEAIPPADPQKTQDRGD